MKFCRFLISGQARYGLVESVTGEETITRVFTTAPHAADGEWDDLPTRRMEHLRLRDADLLAPVEPSKIVCVGRNYREHAKELGHEIPVEPLIFLKPNSSLLGPGKVIRRPILSQRVHHEGELGVVIGRRCRKISDQEDVRPYILGYTCVNDVTARDLQEKDGQWTRAKGFDTFCPVGPVVSDEPDPWAGTTVETRVNDDLRQQGNTLDFLFSLDVVIRHIAQVMTLFPGDLIATGTPSGVGSLEAGNVVEVRVGGVGSLKNPVEDDQ